MHTRILWAFRHPKRRRQLLIQVAGAVRRSPRIIRPSTRAAGVYDLVMAAGRISGLPVWAGRLATGPQARPLDEARGA
jgi:hypothetical protein